MDGALELGRTQPAQPCSVAPTQQYMLGEYVPSTVVDTENRAVSKTDLDLANMDLYFRRSNTKNE